MITYEFDGWISKAIVGESDILQPTSSDNGFVVGPFEFKKGKAIEWKPGHWPPRRVKITVEIQD